MKKIVSNSLRALVFGSLLATAGMACAQTAVTTSTTTSSAGTVSQFGPDSVTIRTTTSPNPVSYSFTKTTTYVDENGNPVSIETVRSGAPVTVFYTQDGDRMVASRVVVRKTEAPDGSIVEKKTTTTTTSSSNNQ